MSMSATDGDGMDEVSQLWSLLGDLSTQLKTNRAAADDLRRQADDLKGQLHHARTGYALRRFNVDLSTETYHSELERMHVSLVRENNTLAYENRQLTLLAREYHTTLESVMTKFRNFCHATQSHVLNLTAHYERQLSATSYNQAHDALTASTTSTATLEQLGTLVRRALRAAEGEDPGDLNLDPNTDAMLGPLGDNLGGMPSFYGSGGYFGKWHDSAADAADAALERQVNEQHLYEENRVLRSLLGIAEEPPIYPSSIPSSTVGFQHPTTNVVPATEEELADDSNGEFKDAPASAATATTEAAASSTATVQGDLPPVGVVPGGLPGSEKLSLGLPRNKMRALQQAQHEVEQQEGWAQEISQVHAEAQADADADTEEAHEAWEAQVQAQQKEDDVEDGEDSELPHKSPHTAFTPGPNITTESNEGTELTPLQQVTEHRMTNQGAWLDLATTQDQGEDHLGELLNPQPPPPEPQQQQHDDDPSSPSSSSSSSSQSQSSLHADAPSSAQAPEPAPVEPETQVLQMPEHEQEQEQAQELDQQEGGEPEDGLNAFGPPVDGTCGADPAGTSVSPAPAPAPTSAVFVDQVGTGTETAHWSSLRSQPQAVPATSTTTPEAVSFSEATKAPLKGKLRPQQPEEEPTTARGATDPLTWAQQSEQLDVAPPDASRTTLSVVPSDRPSDTSPAAATEAEEPFTLFNLGRNRTVPLASPEPEPVLSPLVETPPPPPQQAQAAPGDKNLTRAPEAATLGRQGGEKPRAPDSPSLPQARPELVDASAGSTGTADDGTSQIVPNKKEVKEQSSVQESDQHDDSQSLVFSQDKQASAVSHDDTEEQIAAGSMIQQGSTSSSEVGGRRSQRMVESPVVQESSHKPELERSRGQPKDLTTLSRTEEYKLEPNVPKPTKSNDVEQCTELGGTGSSITPPSPPTTTQPNQPVASQEEDQAESKPAQPVEQAEQAKSSTSTSKQPGTQGTVPTEAESGTDDPNTESSSWSSSTVPTPQVDSTK